MSDNRGKIIYIYHGVIKKHFQIIYNGMKNTKLKKLDYKTILIVEFQSCSKICVYIYIYAQEERPERNKPKH